MKMKKLNIAILTIALILFSNCSYSFATNTTLYKGYTTYSTSSSSSIHRITDGKNPLDNSDPIVFCYNFGYRSPEGKDSNNNTLYTKIENFLESDDPSISIYGPEVRQKIANILIAGYPIDAYGISKRHNINADQATFMTQALLWCIMDGNDNPMPEPRPLTIDMIRYYNELLEYANISEFKQGVLSLKGKFEFKEKDGIWSTDKLSTTGSKGSFTFENLPDDMQVKDFNTGDILKGDISVGQEFYITCNNLPSSDLNLKLKYKYQEAEFYFYKYDFGGKYDESWPYQDLIRAQLLDDIKTINLQLKINGNFEEYTIVDSEDTITPDNSEDNNNNIEDNSGIISPDDSDDSSNTTEDNSNSNDTQSTSPNTGEVTEIRIYYLIGFASLILMYLLNRKIVK